MTLQTDTVVNQFQIFGMDSDPSTRLIVKNLPRYYTDRDLAAQFSSIGEITDCRILLKSNGKSRGFGFVGFRTVDDATRARSHFDSTFVDTARIAVDYAKSIGDPSLDECYARRGKVRPPESPERPHRHDPLDDDPEYLAFVAAARARDARPSWNDGPVQSSRKRAAAPTAEPVETEPEPTNRIYVTNIPYQTTDDSIESFFSKYGEVTDVLVPIDTIAKRSKGFAFVTFEDSESAARVLKEAVIFEGRHLRVQPAEPAPPSEKVDLPDDDESFQKRKHRLQKVDKPQSWNALFLNKDTVMEATAVMLGISKAELLNPASDDLATRVTLAEAQLVRETKSVFEKAGIDLSLFDNPSAKLSRTLIIAKNLKYQVSEEEIHGLFAAFGSLVRFVFPPTHASALVEFARPEDAKKAYRALNFRKVLDQPMLLQWAPVSASAGPPEDVSVDVPRKPSKAHDQELKSATLIMKNVPFKATKHELYDIVNAFVRVRSIRMPKKADGSGHRGFAFLDFNTKQDAMSALENLGNVHLYDRHLVVEPTEHGRSLEAALG
jgi:multiple RNA-binding domain-containing protein 1